MSSVAGVGIVWCDGCPVPAKFPGSGQLSLQNPGHHHHDIKLLTMVIIIRIITIIVEFLPLYGRICHYCIILDDIVLMIFSVAVTVHQIHIKHQM